MPTPLTPLIGREDDIDTVCGLLDADDSRILTLIGPGGVGKTRLAIGVATRLESEFAHGAAFVPLAPVRDPALVTAAVAGALGLDEEGTRSLDEFVASVLRERHLLLVLDNTEHLVEPVARWLSDLLVACPRLTALVTSRVALHIDGEKRYDVPPLALPVEAQIQQIDLLSSTAAVTLFTQRARAVAPGFTLTSENAGTVASVVCQLEGLPLAIELAAGRCAMLSPAALLARLTDRLVVLTGGRRDAPDRHQTMRHAIAWSYDLLSPDEQWLLRRLSVFVGGFTVEAAEAVGGDGALDRLTTLVDHSLVRQMTLPGSQQRLRMLETIREFGLEHLVAHGEDVAARDTHAAMFMALAEAAEAGIMSHGQAGWLDRLGEEHDNLRAAIAWLRDQARIDDALALVVHISEFLDVRGHHSEGWFLYQSLLDHPAGAERSRERAAALLDASFFVLKLDRPESARAMVDDALAMSRELGDRHLIVKSLRILGINVMVQGQHARAAELVTESLALARATSDVIDAGRALTVLSMIAVRAGDLDAATAFSEEALQICRDVGDAWSVGFELSHLGSIALNRERYDQAEAYFVDSVRQFRLVGDRRELPQGLAGLAGIAIARGDFPAAAAYLDEGLTVAEQTGNARNIATIHLGLGRLARLRGEYQRSSRLLVESQRKFEEVGERAGVAEGLDELAAIALATGDAARAAWLLGAADGVLDRLGTSRTPGTLTTTYERMTRETRGKLGPSAFSDASSAGHACSIAEIFSSIGDGQAASPGDAAPAAVPATGGLSPRELEVLRLIADGLTNQEIADALSISPRTATSHATHILTKLDLSTRTAAVAFAIRNGLA